MLYTGHIKFLYNSKFDFTAKSLVTNTVVIMRVLCTKVPNSLLVWNYPPDDQVPLTSLVLLFHTLVTLLHLHLQWIKVYKYTFRGSNSSIFIFASLLYMGQLLMKRICSFPYSNNFFPLRKCPILEGLCPPGKQTRSHIKTCHRDRIAHPSHKKL